MKFGPSGAYGHTKKVMLRGDKDLEMLIKILLVESVVPRLVPMIVLRRC